MRGLPGAGRRSVEVMVKMKDGREFSEHTDTWKGDPLSAPLSKDEIIANSGDSPILPRPISRERAGEF